jgi:hypothetical protein
MAMDDNGNDSNVVKEWRWMGGGGVADAAWRLEHLATCCRLSISLHREGIAHTMHKNGVMILAGLTGSGKST